MNEARLEAMETRSVANEKLLKALITLLAVREPQLLDELGAIFMLAAAEDSEVGGASSKVWAEVRREMDVMHQLMRAGDHELDGEIAH
ncbi:MAG: hypothetical protein INR64_16185 [Caulobacteraceae bacterium]|nr:hypothetical protein [Caulobacter sp.]